MNVKSTQSHYYSAQELLRQGQFKSASREAELAVDGFWKEGDAKIVQALPLLSILRHSNRVDGDLFESLVDLPTSFSDSLMFESMSLHEQYQNDASEKMMADVNRLMKRWVEQPKAAPAEDSIVEDSVFEEMLFGEAVAEQGFIFEEEAVEEAVVDELLFEEAIDEESVDGESVDGESVDEKAVVPEEIVDEKIAGLREQILQFYADDKRDFAVEASLQLANEYALRGKKKRAFKLFTQVAQKSKRPERTSVRIDCLLDFGQFMSRNNNLADAERLLRIAAGVARNARDEKRFARVLVALGVVLMHQSKNEVAKKHLERANSMLNVWDVELDIVKQHLKALAEGVPCECRATVSDLSLTGTDWD